jgi:mRNA interferase MazF
VNLLTGDVVWGELGPSRGREQSGRRPLVIVSSNDYLALIDSLVLVVPVTSRDRGWPNHVPIGGNTGLGGTSFAMTEQLMTVSRERITGLAGETDKATIEAIRVYLRDFLGM